MISAFAPNVFAAKNSIELSNSRIMLAPGQTMTMRLTFSPYGEYEKVTFKSTDADIVTASYVSDLPYQDAATGLAFSMGVFTVTAGTKEGRATITAETPSGAKDSLTVTVRKAGEKVAVKGVEIGMSTMNGYEGETLQLTAYIVPVDATDSEIEWSSDNENVIIPLTDGEFLCVGQGTATVTAASYNGLFASCAVTVKPAAQSPSVIGEQGKTITQAQLKSKADINEGTVKISGYDYVTGKALRSVPDRSIRFLSTLQKNAYLTIDTPDTADFSGIVSLPFTCLPYGKDSVIIKYEQAGSFPFPVKTQVKTDSISGEVKLYSLLATGELKEIETSAQIDANGFLTFKTNRAGSIVVTIQKANIFTV
jgi:uncharacterized protein YjdB